MSSVALSKHGFTNTSGFERPFRHGVAPATFHPLITIIIITSSSSHPPKSPRRQTQSLDLRDPRKYIPKTLVNSRHHSLHSQTTSCSISFTRGTRSSCKPQNAATFSICFFIKCQPQNSPSNPIRSQNPPNEDECVCKKGLEKDLHTAAQPPHPQNSPRSASSLSNATPSPGVNSAS
jgi:hypothetical protein